MGGQAEDVHEVEALTGQPVHQGARGGALLALGQEQVTEGGLVPPGELPDAQAAMPAGNHGRHPGQGPTPVDHGHGHLSLGGEVPQPLGHPAMQEERARAGHGQDERVPRRTGGLELLQGADAARREAAGSVIGLDGHGARPAYDPRRTGGRGPSRRMSAIVSDNPRT